MRLHENQFMIYRYKIKIWYEKNVVSHYLKQYIMFYRIQFDTVSDDMVVYNIVSYETI